MNRRNLLLGILGAAVGASPIAKVVQAAPYLKVWTYTRSCYHCGNDIDTGRHAESCQFMQQLIRALESGNYNTAPERLMSGCSLAVESLEPTMQAVTFDENHINLA